VNLATACQCAHYDSGLCLTVACGCDHGPNFQARTRPVRRPKASVELSQTLTEDAITSLREIADGNSRFPSVTLGALADILAAALEQAKAEDLR
jgi:hypothetical protein